VRRFSRRHPFSAVLLLVIGLLTVLAWGPLQSYSAAAARVEALQATHDRLEQEVERLAERRAALQDPEEIELLARRQHGLVRPGEVPFIVVTEEPQPEVGDPAVVQRVDGDAWWRDLVQRAAELLP
jgi:cell division protein FtsB